jgi:hypothetical protein
MTNRFESTCARCQQATPPGCGTLQKGKKASRRSRWSVICGDCLPLEADGVAIYHSPTTGWTGTRNKRGRCEDAPCCGCCTF